MSSARIVIAQSGVTGAAGISRDDIITGQPVTLTNEDDSGVRSWRWRFKDRPTGSASTLSSPTSAQVTFTPDVAGSYLIELKVDEGLIGQTSTLIAAVRETLGVVTDLRMPAAGESNEANWDSNVRGSFPDLEAWLRASAGAATDHGALTGLADDDHTQYLRTDGTRAATGSQAFSAASPTITIGSGAGTGTISAGAGGAVVLRSADRVGGNLAAGIVTVVTGTSTGTADGQNVNVTAGAAGNGSSSNAGGNAVITGGAGGTTAGSAAGAVLLQGGTPIDGQGGAIVLTAADGVGTDRSGGNVVLIAGAETGAGTPGTIEFQLEGGSRPHVVLGYDGSVLTFGAFNATPVVQPTVPAAAVDPATTMALVNAIRTALVDLGWVV